MTSPGSSTEDPNQQIAQLGGGRPHAILVVLCRVKTDRPRADHGRNIETKPECRVYLFPTTVPAAVWLFCRRPKHTTDDTTTTTTRDKKTPRARSRAPSRAWNVWPVDMAGLWCSSRARARSCGASRREAQGHLNHKPPQRRGGMWLGMWDVPRGTGSVFSCSMIVLNIPRRLRWPHRADSKRNVHNNS